MTDTSAHQEQLKIEIERLRKAAADQEWAIKKTNEGIKLLYKELENKNRELEKLDEMKSDFVSTVSHELRTPMTIIKESIAQVVDGVVGPVSSEQNKLLSMALNNIERLARIINNLLDISKIEAGKFELHCEEFDIRDIVEEVTEGFRLSLQKRGLELKSEFVSGNTRIKADRDKLIQVLTNLIGNAGKFTEKGGVTVRVRPQPDLLRCEVSDTGIGMAPREVAKAFSKFQQFGRKNGAGEKGTGLGLAICKGIVELHRGDIWIESEPGKGTTFVFTIPR